MTQVLLKVDPENRLDIRELLVCTGSMTAAHTTMTRPTIDQLIANFEVDGGLLSRPPTSIAIFDDVLTTGAHFLAAKTLLQRQFPGISIRGLFGARRVFPDLI